jgi:hypothetical protein
LLIEFLDGIRHDFSCIFLAVRKKFEKAANGNRSEFEERYAFLIENDAQVFDICTNGYHCAETSFNVLGRYTYIFILNMFFILKTREYC